MLAILSFMVNEQIVDYQLGSLFSLSQPERTKLKVVLSIKKNIIFKELYLLGFYFKDGLLKLLVLNRLLRTKFTIQKKIKTLIEKTKKTV